MSSPATIAHGADESAALSATGVGRLAILMYHSLDTSGSVVSVAPAEFAGQMACLAEVGFRGISLREAVAYRQVHGSWPARTVVLTFDDGYANFHEFGMSTLARHGFTATVFLVSGHVGGRNDWAPPPAGLGTRAILSRGQARDLFAAGVEIGAHTRTHPDLRRLSARQAESEIAGGRSEIAGWLGAPVEGFAYPFGSISLASREIVAREFKSACSTVLRRAGSDPLLRLPRVDMYYVRSRRMLARLVTGELDRHLALRRWGRAVRRLVQPVAGPLAGYPLPAGRG